MMSVDRSPRTSKLPNFLVIGAMKAGTTSLYHYLRHHPQICMAETKEVNFFNPLRNWRRGLEWYEKQFQHASDDVVAIGEASTSYTKFPWIRGVPERIVSVLGDVRLIYVVRPPIERMRSHYLHNLATGQEWRPIEEAFSGESMYLNISRYGLQIERYLPYFSLEQVLVIESSSLRDDRVETLRKVFRFLGVDDSWTPSLIEHEFYRSVDRNMKPQLIRKMRRISRLQTIAVYVPEPIKRWKRNLADELPVKQLDTSRGDLSDELVETIRDSLRDDVAKFRSFVGSGFDGWGIDDGASQQGSRRS